MGKTVTVTAEVVDVYSPKAFILNGDKWGDDSVLVLSGPDVKDVQEGEVVQVTGTVRQFDYDVYETDYGLADPGLYGPYGEEEFMEADKIDKTSDSSVSEPSATS